MLNLWRSVEVKCTSFYMCDLTLLYWKVNLYFGSYTLCNVAVSFYIYYKKVKIICSVEYLSVLCIEWIPTTVQQFIYIYVHVHHAKVIYMYTVGGTEGSFR